MPLRAHKGGLGPRLRFAETPAARAAVTLLTTCCLLASCSSAESPERAADPGRTAMQSSTPRAEASGKTRSPAPPPAPAHATEPLPSVPARDPTVLAGQLDRATAALRDPDSAVTAVRRAGQFQQLAVHALVTGSGRFRRAVLAELDPTTAPATRSALRAVRPLHAITTPQSRLPRWRIVTPPPPERLLGHYRRAQRRTGVPWTYLAAIHLVETRMGRIRGTSTAGARGPMQFLPSTWDLYGGRGDITDPRDAILAAARLLRDNGAPGDMAGALWHYNPSRHYVRAVSAHARAMQRSTTAYRGYWHWRVLYRHKRGTYVLPVGYPEERPVLLPAG